MPITTNEQYGVSSQIPTFDTSVPDIPTTYKPAAPTQNPYSVNTPAYQLWNEYNTNLGRAPEAGIIDWRVSQLPTTPLDQQLKDIAGSQEARTLGRARNEIGSQVTEQQAALQRSLEQSRLDASNQLQALAPYFNSQFGGLDFGLQAQLNALANERQQALDSQTMQQQSLQDSINPAILAAKNATIRSGVLNSTILADRINQGLNPIYRALGNLALTTNTRLGDITNRQTTTQSKYAFDTQNLIQQREQQAKAIRDKLAMLVQQSVDQQNQLQASLMPKVYARAGELGDTVFTQGLQQQQLASDLQNRAFQQQMAQQEWQLKLKQLGLA